MPYNNDGLFLKLDVIANIIHIYMCMYVSDGFSIIVDALCIDCRRRIKV